MLYVEEIMSFSAAVQNVATAGLVLQVFLVAALIAKKAWGKFPLFFVYVVLNLLETAALLALMQQRHAYFYGYAISETVTILLGLGVFCEIFVHLFSLYPALRRVAWLSLVAAIILIALIACWVLQAHSPIGRNGVAQALLVIEESARVLEVGLIAFLFLFASLFGLHWRQSVFGIALGLGVYVIGKLLVLTVVPHVSPSVGQTLNLLHMTGFDCSLLIWLGYILVPEGAPAAVDVSHRTQLEQWNQAIMELINQ